MTKYARGLIYGCSAFSFWGFALLYWDAIASIHPLNIVMHRILWSFLVCLTILIIRRRLFQFITSLCHIRTLLITFLRALLITSNWFVFALSVLQRKTLDAGFGYTISPILSMMLGIIFLKERLVGLEYLAFLLTLLSVGYLTWVYGAVPWIGLTLAITFSCYGLLRKISTQPPFEMVTAEMGLTAIFSLVFILYYSGSEWTFVASPFLIAGLIGSGCITIIPLAFFGAATKYVPLIVIGFLNYITPLIMFVISFSIFGESLSLHRLPGFILAWLAVVVFIMANIRKIRSA